MKRWGLAFTLALGCLSAWAQEYTPEFLAQHMTKRDHERGLPNDEARIAQMTYMLNISAEQCRRDSGNQPAALRVADKVMYTRDRLEKEGISVSMYDLLDVLKGMLGDGQKGWDCAAFLAAYMEARLTDPTITHIGAYKMLQGMRDSGILHARSQ